MGNKRTSLFLDIVSCVTFVYSISFMFLTLLYCLPRLLAEINLFDMSFINEAATFDLDIFAEGLLAICAIYCGIDRTAFAVKTSMMEIGSCDVGDIGRLKKVILILSIIFVENYILNLLLGHSTILVTSYGKQEFHGIDLPMKGVIRALVTSCILCVAGGGAIGICKNIKIVGKKEDNTKTEEVKEEESE